MLKSQEEQTHKPVLVQKLLSLFSTNNPPRKILDCTFGRGGHSLALLKNFPQTRITALDCDKQAIQYGHSLQEVKEGKIKLIKVNFHQFAQLEEKKTKNYELILMDLGVSSPQLDNKERGFSFYQEGPLDMRMDRQQELKASDIINTWGRKELIQLFQNYGEIKKPYKIVSAILEYRKKRSFETTRELSQLIKKQGHHRTGRKHPATPWFLALRIQVNQELSGLKKSLPDFLPLLKETGFFVVISFHSLEDRIVKKTFREFLREGKGRLWNKKALTPDEEERKKNPRSRSAKMRVFQKVSPIA